MLQDTEWLKDHDCEARDLKSKLRDIDRGDGNVLLWALANYRGTRIELSKLILERWKKNVRNVKHLGRFLKPHSLEVLSFLERQGYPHAKTLEYDQEGKIRTDKDGHEKRKLVTKDFLKNVKREYPDIFEKFVDWEANLRRADEFNAMAEGRASISGKRSQWWLEMFERHCQAENRISDYHEMVRLIAWYQVIVDLNKMRNRLVPKGYNIHHIISLSNFFHDKLVQRTSKKHVAKIQKDLEQGKNIVQYFKEPSIEMVRRFAEFGAVSSTKRWSAFTSGQLSFDERWLPLLKGEEIIDQAWIDQASFTLQERLFKNGLFDMPVPVYKKNSKGKKRWIFDSNCRSKLTRAGLHPRHYVRLIKAGMTDIGPDGKFDRQKYNQCAMDICRDIMIETLAEERAKKYLAGMGFFGGNQSGLCFNSDGVLTFLGNVCNYLVANSSKEHPRWGPHAGIHVGQDGQSDSSFLGAESIIYACLPNDIILPGPQKDHAFWDAGAMFSKSFGDYEKHIHRKTWWMLLETELEHYLPKDAKFGALPPPSQSIPKEIKNLVDHNISPYAPKKKRRITNKEKKKLFEKGKIAGTWVANKKLGRIPVNDPIPWMPEEYSIEFHAGLRIAREKVFKDYKKEFQELPKERNVRKTEPEKIPKPMQDQRDRYSSLFSSLLSESRETRQAVLSGIQKFPNRLSEFARSSVSSLIRFFGKGDK